MTGRRAHEAQELSEVVRERLQVLLAEVPPRRLAERDGTRATGASARDESEVPDEGEEHAPAPAGEGVAAPPGARGPLTDRLRLLRQGLVFAREHLVALAIVLLAGAAWGAYGLLQARTTPVAAAATTSPPAVSVSAPSAGPVPSGTPSSSAPPVLVHVLGAVRHPGVVSLPAGARVTDAIAAAGGLTRSAAPAELNLAAIVTDGSQIVIGTRAHPRGDVRQSGDAPVGSPTSAAAKVNLNTATLAQLDTLPGVGPVTAAKILDWRTAHGRFARVQELQEVDGIGPKTYADLAPHVSV